MPIISRLAGRLHGIREEIDPEQLAFELHAFAPEANWADPLLETSGAFERARRTVTQRIEDAELRSGGACHMTAAPTPQRPQKSDTLVREANAP